jgi:hypothetical protein
MHKLPLLCNLFGQLYKLLFYHELKRYMHGNWDILIQNGQEHFLKPVKLHHGN